MFRRVFLIVLDGLGVGALPDASRFGDETSATFQHIFDAVKPNVRTLLSLGLGNIAYHSEIPLISYPRAFWGRMSEKSAGKDTTSGHWEMMGIIRKGEPRTFPNGFPQSLIDELSRHSGYEFLGNKPASGTEIIKELGEEHIRTGKLIIYTSADSVLQIAAHKEVVSLEELYRVCEIARSICQGEWEVDRIIARPFIGSNRDSFVRTYERRDFSLTPPRNYLDNLLEKNIPVFLVGKLGDIFPNAQGAKNIHTGNNQDTMSQLDVLVSSEFFGLIFANLIDFDSLYGHRNDTKGYARALEEFDQWLIFFLSKLSKEDLLILTSDHGNDPTTSSTDHSREYAPILVYSPSLEHTKLKKHLEDRESFADVGATIVDNFGIKPQLAGKSFLDVLKQF